MPEQNRKKLSHQAKGILLILAAVPLMVILGLYYDDNLAMGAVPTLLLAWGAIELGKKPKDDEGKTDG